MNEASAKASKLNTREQAIAYCDKVKTLFGIIRNTADSLETIVDNQHWPLPKYRELLFTR
jgi:glutamine synthetase